MNDRTIMSKVEYTVQEVYALAGLPPRPRLSERRLLNLRLERWGWKRVRKSGKTSKATWVAPSASSMVPKIGDFK